MSLRTDREYAESPAGILSKQRERVLSAAEALVFWIEQPRKCDLRPQEVEMLGTAKAYLESARKPVAREAQEPGEGIRIA